MSSVLHIVTSQVIKLSTDQLKEFLREMAVGSPTNFVENSVVIESTPHSVENEPNRKIHIKQVTTKAMLLDFIRARHPEVPSGAKLTLFNDLTGELTWSDSAAAHERVDAPTGTAQPVLVIPESAADMIMLAQTYATTIKNMFPVVGRTHEINQLRENAKNGLIADNISFDPDIFDNVLNGFIASGSYRLVYNNRYVERII